MKDSSTPLGSAQPEEGSCYLLNGGPGGKASFGLKSEMRVLDTQVEKLSRQMWVKDRVLGAKKKTASAGGSALPYVALK